MTDLSTMLCNSERLETRHFINGKFCDGSAGRVFPVYNPANGALLTEVADGTAEDAVAAVEAAAGALDDWRRRTAKERAGILKRWHALIAEAREDLATLMTLEQGKPIAEARAEVDYGNAFVEWFAEEAKRANGEVIPAHLPGRKILVQKAPIGVVAAITPWNFPIAMGARKAAAALAAGCTFVLKPAQDTPLCALALAVLAREAGIPDGVFNVVCCEDPAPVGTVLTTHPEVRKVTFTGSTTVGKQLMAQCASTVKRTSMELGGNAPFIIFDDADLDAAIAAAMVCKFRNAGQTCVCANRILVQDAVYDEVVARLHAGASALVAGDGLAAGTTLGPMINQGAVRRVNQIVQDSIAQGARALLGGEPSAPDDRFFAPTLLTDISPQQRVFTDEIFGPVAPVLRFESEAEAISLANDTRYGLAAYCFTQDLGRTFRVVDGLEYGMVAVNEGILSTEVAPFGGVKESGIGREGSQHGIDEYLDLKYALIGGLG